MKDWIALTFLIRPKLESMTAIIDKKVQRLALSPGGDTLGTYNKIVALNDEKIGLINLKIIYERFCAALGAEEAQLFKQFIFGATMQELADFEGTSKTTIFRRLNKTYKKCAKVIKALGYTEQRLESEYFGILLVRHTFKKNKRQNREDICMRPAGLRTPAPKPDSQSASAFL